MSLPLHLRCRLWWRRSLLYRFTWVSTSCVLIGGGGLWASAQLSERSMNLAPRLSPHARSHVTLKLPQLTPQEQRALTQARFGVPVHLTHPSLRLIGTLEEVEPLTTGGARLKLGVYPQEAKHLTRDAQLSLSLEAPSLSLLLEDLTRSQRGQVAVQRARSAWRNLMERARALSNIALEELKRSLPPNLLSRLRQDKVVMGRVEALFEQEVINQVPWGELMAGALESEEFTKLREVALKDVKVTPLVGHMLQGAAEHALKSRSVFKGFDFKHPVRSTRRVQKKIKDKKDSIIEAGVQRVGRQLMNDVKRNLKREGELVRREGGKLLAQQAKHAHFDEYVQGWIEALTQDEVLKRHLKLKYQGEVFEGFAEALNRLKERPEVKKVTQAALSDLKSALGALGRALLFDHNLTRPGPNPLLISVIEELVRGEASPVIRVMSGEGAPAAEGFEFSPRPQAQIDWTALLFSDKGAQGTGDE